MRNDRLHLEEAALPVLRSVDVVVVSGACSAVESAVACARAGLRVLLVERRTYLGWEIAATLRPWLAPSRRPERGFWRELLRRISGDAETPGEIPLKMDDLKCALEDMCLEAGADILYASHAVDVIVDACAVAGIVIGNKSGRQVIRARAVIDASETGLVARLAGAELKGSGSSYSSYRRTLEFDGVAENFESTLAVPHELGIAGDCVTVHPGYRGNGHVFVELALDLPGGEGLEADMEREIAARHISMALAEYLMEHVPAFGESMLAASSLELDGPGVYSPVTLPVGLWRLPRGFRGDGEAPAAERSVSEIRTYLDADGRSRADYVTPAVRALAPDRGAAPSWSTALAEREGPQQGRRYERQQVEAGDLPILARTEVLVVGGGASGASAAITAAREGSDTVLLEMNPGLGGTGTLAGVHSYWYGRHVGFSAEVQRLTDEVQQRLRHTKATWNIEAKMYALLRAADGAGARVLFNTVVIGALMEGRRVRGVVAATPWGPQAVLADVVVDATGDGDVAAFAGAPFIYGAECDHTTMWYSLGQFTTPGRTRNNFTSMVDVSNIEDYTRAILAGRRRGTAVHDHSVYLAPRESRHVLGEVVMTHTDQLLLREWADVVNIHYSNHDVKGCSTSPWVRVGLIPPNLEIEVPYRALLPRGIEGIIVTGKAISATHDALPAVRMQADMETLGSIVAMAASMAVHDGTTPRDIDVAALQRRLVGEGVLPERVLTRVLERPLQNEDTLRNLVAGLTGERPLYDYSDMEMGEIFEGRLPFVDACTAGPAIIPFLEEALCGASGLRRQHLAQALAMYGSPSALRVLREAIEEHLAGGYLPVRDNQIRHAGYPPDQGAMPDLVYLLYSLGMVSDPSSISIWERVADLIEATEDDVRDRRQGTFYYVEAVCWSAEQLGDRCAIPLLERLHTRPALHGNVCPAGYQPDFFLERQAMMELMIGRALARCGSDRGLRILVDYLQDARALLAEQAHSHLVAITGRDFGKEWGDWLAELQLGWCHAERAGTLATSTI